MEHSRLVVVTISALPDLRWIFMLIFSHRFSSVFLGSIIFALPANAQVLSGKAALEIYSDPNAVFVSDPGHASESAKGITEVATREPRRLGRAVGQSAVSDPDHSLPGRVIEATEARR